MVDGDTTFVAGEENAVRFPDYLSDQLGSCRAYQSCLEKLEKNGPRDIC